MLGVGVGGGFYFDWGSGPNIEKFKRLALENKSHLDL